VPGGVLCSTDFVARTGGAFGGASPDLLLTLGGARVGLFGLTTPLAAQTSRPGPEVAFGEPIPVARNVAASLRARGASVVVAVPHLTMAEDKAIAAAADVDVILGRTRARPARGRGRQDVHHQGGLGRALPGPDRPVLTRDGRLVERSWRFREVSRRVQADQAVEALVREYARRLDRELEPSSDAAKFSSRRAPASSEPRRRTGAISSPTRCASDWAVTWPSSTAEPSAPIAPCRRAR
jgi:hypothetical protein